ncbi:MAG: hypothetical protein F4Y86_00235 [Gammaproteobacteria bacterium]|nr:hypothetical protein [Gammaproteobacteria bacterium]
MIVDIQTRRLRTIKQLRAFVEGSEAVDFKPRGRDDAYGFVRETLERVGHRGLGKADKVSGYFQLVPPQRHRRWPPADGPHVRRRGPATEPRPPRREAVIAGADPCHAG